MSTVTLLDHFVNVGQVLWRASWQASVLVVLIGAIHLVFGRHISPRWRHAMWMLVLVRLALPVVPSSPISLFNLAPANVVPTPPIEADVPLPRAGSHGKSLGRPSPNRPRSEMILVEDTMAPLLVAAEASAAVPVPAADLEAKSNGISWLRLAVSIWLAIASLMTARVLWATLRLARTIRRLTRVEDEAANEILSAAAREMHVQRPPKLLAGEGLFSPALVGFIRPKLLLPTDLLAQFEPAELRLIFLHELAHLKRRDVAINWVATILSILHWPNPIVWLAVRRLRLERELACDELVVSRASDTERRAYGHTIVKLLETFSRGVSPMPGSVGILEGKQQMKRRITMIARFAKRNRVWSAVAAVLLLGLSACALTDGTKVKADAPETSPAAAAAVEAPSTLPAGPRDLATTIQTTPVPNDTTPKIAKVNLDPTDYVIGPQDVVAITIFDLEGPGKQTIKKGPVSATGKVILPFLKDPVQIAGLTEDAARKAIAQAYVKGGVLENPTIDVSVAEAKNLPPKPSTINVDELVTVTVADLMGSGVDAIKTSRVNAEGNITFPYAGQVKIAGLKPEEAQDAVGKALEKNHVMLKPVVVVSLPDRGESHVLRAARDGKGGPATAPADAQAMSHELKRVLPEINFDSVPFSDVIDFLRDTTGLNFAVNWRAIEEVGIDRNAPVSLKLKNVALKEVMAIILAGLHPNLQFKADGGVIQITMAATEAKTEVKAYDVADLLPVALPEGEKFETKTAELGQVIMDSVQPDSWRQGDKAGENSISVFGTKLVVTASAEVHDAVQNLLEEMRSSTHRPTTSPAGK